MFQEEWLVIYSPEKIKYSIATNHSQIHWMDVAASTGMILRPAKQKGSSILD